MVSLSLRKVLVFVELELRRLRHDPTEVFTRAVQPILWIGVFGTAMNRIRAIPTGSVDYLTYITPGVLMQSTSFIAMAYGIMLVWERESGILKKVLTLPLSHFTITLGRSFAGAARALTQLFVILMVALPLGVKIILAPEALLLAMVAVFVGAAGLTALSILLAAFMKTRERFMGIIQAVTMPLFFASNAIYPVEIMPLPIRLISLGNPLTYVIQALRDALVYGAYFDSLYNICIVALFSAGMITLASVALRRIIE
ncbi:MAG: ABC transporter permease [Thermofilum sp.]